MSNKDYDLEQRAEDILRAFAMEMGNNNEKFVRAVLDENQPDPPLFLEEETPLETESGAEITPSVPAEEELPTGFTPVTPRRSRKILRRTLILAAVLILMMGLVVCTSEGVRLKLSSLFFGDAPGSTRVLDDSNLVVDLEKVELGYVPEGFEVVSDEMVLDFERRIEAKNDVGSIIIMHMIKNEQYVYNIDNEYTAETKILINDREAYCFNNGDETFIMWQIGDSTFQLTSTIDKQILVEVAKKIVLR